MEWLAGRQLGTAAKGLSEAISPGEIVRSLLGNQDGHGTTFGVHHLTDEDRPGLWLTFDFGSFLDLVPYKARTQDEATKGQNTDQQRETISQWLSSMAFRGHWSPDAQPIPGQ